MEFSTWDMFSLLGGLFIMIGVGYVGVKVNFIPGQATGVFSKLLVKITMPCTVFLSMNRPYDDQFLSDGVHLMILSCVLVAMYTAFSVMITKLVGVPKHQRGAWKLCCVFCNAGFVGFPIALAVFGEEGLSLLAMMNIPLTVMFYSLGRYFAHSGATGGEEVPSSLVKVLCSEINLCLALGLVCYIQQWTLPELLLVPVTHLGNMTTPLSMLVVGMTLAGCKIGSMFKDRAVMSATVTRLFLFPALTYGLVSVLPWFTGVLPALVVVILATPAPGIAPTLVTSHGGDGEVAAKIVFLTSVLSIFTMTMWLSVF